MIKVRGGLCSPGVTQPRREPREPRRPPTAGELLDLVRTGRASTRSQLRMLTGLSRTASRPGHRADVRRPAAARRGARLDRRPAARGRWCSTRTPALSCSRWRSVARAASSRCSTSTARRSSPDSRDHEVGVGPGRADADIVDRLVRSARRRRAAGARHRPQPARHPRPRPRAQHRLPGDDRLGRRRAGAVLRTDLVARAAVRRERRRRARPRPSCSAAPAASTTCWSSRPPTGLGLGIVAGGRVLSGTSARPARSATPRSTQPASCPAGAARPAAWRRSRAAGHWWPSSGSPANRSATCATSVALALQGDSGARGLLRDSGRELGEVLAVAINLLNPGAVVIGGDMAAGRLTSTSRACARASTGARRRWPPATCSSCRRRTVTAPASSARRPRARPRAWPGGGRCPLLAAACPVLGSGAWNRTPGSGSSPASWPLIFLGTGLLKLTTPRVSGLVEEGLTLGRGPTPQRDPIRPLGLGRGARRRRPGRPGLLVGLGRSLVPIAASCLDRADAWARSSCTYAAASSSPTRSAPSP